MAVFIDSSFDILQADNYLLSGQIDLTGFSFAVTDLQGACKTLKTLTFQHAILSYDDWAQELGELFQKEPLLQKKYRSSTWTFLSNKSTLIPERFLQPSQLRTCLEYSSNLDDLDEVHYRPILAFDAICVFAVPSPPANMIIKYQPNTRFIHQQVQLLSQIEALQGANRALLHVTSSLVDVLIYADNKLVLSNTYPIRAFSDALYNLTFALKTHNLSNCDLMLYYAGQVSADDDALLRKYYKNIRNLYNEAVRLHIGEKNATTHYSLLTLAQCG